MNANGETREELLLRVEKLQAQLAAVEHDHWLVVAGLKEEQRLAEAAWQRRLQTLAAQLSGFSEVTPALSQALAGLLPAEGDMEPQRLLAAVQKQASELQAANEELMVQTEELQAANEKLTVQAEELRIQNEELTNLNEDLEGRKHELEQLAQELANERTLLISVLEQMPASVVIVAAPTGPIILSNHRAQEIWGEPLENAADLEGFWTVPRYSVDGLIYKKSELPLWRSLTLGEVVTDEECLLRPRGRPPMHLSVSSAPVRDHQGVVVAGVVSYADITARRAAEAEIRRLASFPQLNPNPVLEIDLTGSIIYCNQAGQAALQSLDASLSPEAFFPEDIKEILVAGREGREERFYREVPLKGVVFAEDIYYIEALKVFRIYVRDITERQKAEEALRESREDLNRAQAVAHSGSWRLDVRRNELMWSDETYRIFGIPPGTPLTYETFLTAVYPEDREHVDRQWTAALGGEPYDIEHRIVAGDTIKWVRERAELEVDPEGKLLGGFGTVQDITAFKQAEAALIQAKEEWEHTFDAVPDYISLLDKEHRITRINRAMGELLGKTPEKVIGQTCYQAVHSLDAPPDYCPHSRVLATGQEYATEVQEFGCTFAVSVSPLFGPDGQLQGGVHVARDITAAKQAEEALQQAHKELEVRVQERTAELRDTVAQLIEEVQERQQAEESLRKQAELLELAQEAIIVRDLDSRVIFWNRGAEETYGWPREQAAGRDIHTLLNTRFPVTKEEAVQELFQTGRWFGELVHRRAGGEEIIVASRQALQRDDQGKPAAILEINRDVTARRRAEEALETERQRLLSVLERIPAHVALLRPDHTFAYVNGEFIRRFGEPDAKRCFELNGRKNPCEECQAMAVFHTGKQVVWEWTAPDGRSYETYDYPFADVDGSPLVLKMGVDISARKQAEKAFENERQRFLAVLERIPAYVALISPECTIPYANREFIKRFGDPGNRRCYEFLFGLEAPCEGCKALEVFGTKTPALWEWSGPDGNTYQIYDYPFIDVDGSPLVLEMGVDITDRKRTEEQVASLGRMYRMLSKVNEAIVRVSSKDELFRQICRIMMEEGDFLLAWIGLVDPDTGLVRAAPGQDLAGDYVKNITVSVDDGPESQGPTGTAVREGRYDICNDIAADPRMAPWRDSALAHGFRSSGAFPLRVESGIVGALTVYANRPQFFSAEEITLMESLADDLSFALEFLAADAKRRLVEEVLRESEERLRHLTFQLLHAQEKERRYLSLELHDDLGQSLMVLKMQLRVIEKTVPQDQWRTRGECDHCLNYLNGVIDKVRRLARNLRPSVLDDLGLAPGLRVLAEEFRKYREVQITLEMDDLGGLFSREEEINIYRIFQEILTNIAKHAQARHVDIVIKRAPGGVLFQVADDGVGFDVEQALIRDGTREGLGLAALEERVRILGAALTIKSQDQQGTEISFTVPPPAKC